MKVGTDGCLLGGWFNCTDSKRVLDIGCGTGLIAIMAAQRCEAHITGVEIDGTAALQARRNADNSPWGSRIEIANCDFLDYITDSKFDTIVSNPPYFVNSLKCDDSSRTLARHSDSLDCKIFFKKSIELCVRHFLTLLERLKNLFISLHFCVLPFITQHPRQRSGERSR